MNANLAAVLYLVAGVLFILSLRGLSSPASSRQGNFFGMVGMAIAVATTLASHPPADGLAWLLVISGNRHRRRCRCGHRPRVPMTSMPELVAAFPFAGRHGRGAGGGRRVLCAEAFGIGKPGQIHAASLVEMSLGVANRRTDLLPAP